MANIEKRISQKGIQSFRAKIRLKGFRHKTKTFSTETEAFEWANKVEKNLLLKRENENIDADSDDLAHVMICLPKILAEKLKSISPRGQRSQFIINLLEKYFSNLPEKKEINTKRYAAVKQIPSLYPAFTIGGIRHLIFNHKKKEFTDCFKKVGSKIIIDLDNFETWLSNHNN